METEKEYAKELEAERNEFLNCDPPELWIVDNWRLVCVLGSIFILLILLGAAVVMLYLNK